MQHKNAEGPKTYLLLEPEEEEEPTKGTGREARDLRST